MHICHLVQLTGVVFYQFTSFIIETKVHIICQEGGHSQQSAVTWGIWPVAGGSRHAILTSEHHNLIRLATAKLPYAI